MFFVEEFRHLKLQLQDVISATTNFDPNKLISHGGFGKVYKGELSLFEKPCMVAFKRLDSKFGQGNTEFWKEIMMLSKYKHDNLVSLLHFCFEGDEKILVYEYASRGSLDRYLSDISLTWIQRLKICVGVARGLSYLHDPMETKQRVLHRDIKSSNILLDEEWNAKVSDFGLSKVGPANQPQTYLVSNVVGTFGYCDPLYFETGLLSKESDVYSFGVVLFEVMYGRLCCEYCNGKITGILVPMWRKCFEENKLDDIIFHDLREQIQHDSLMTFSTIANKCLQRDHKKRPTMVEIVQELEVAIEHQLGIDIIEESDEIKHIGVKLQLTMSETTAKRGYRETKFIRQPRSPGPRSRVDATTSPLHPRFGSTSLDSPNKKVDDGRSECHPTPLSPGSPTSPSSTLSNIRPCNMKTLSVMENSSCQPSKWKKRNLLEIGTYGHLYLGFHSENRQICVIKEVTISDHRSSKEGLMQLNQEITLLSQLSHPNIVQYYGSELTQESLSLYLEYVSGGSIHKLLQEYGQFREPIIRNYTRQILCGLAYLHGRNTLHRDIRGANILVDPNGEIKLANFGMGTHMTNCTSTLSFKGSPYWMAPEVVMNRNGYNLAVDIWSLGCTILEMATTKPPWGQYEGAVVIFKIGNTKDMPEIPDHLSNDAKSFIKQCLQRDPSLRPSASKLLDHPFVRDKAT